MKFKSLVSFAVALWVLLWPVAPAARQERGQGTKPAVKIKVETGAELDLYDESRALVIGVSDYTAGWRDLPGISADVEQVSAVLAAQGFGVERLPNPTHAQLDAALRRFISGPGLRERNRLLVYFAGHGYTETLGDGRDLGYVVPADAPLPERNLQLFSERALSMNELKAFALRIRAKHALFVFDSCFSGSIFEARSARRTPPTIESKTAAPVRQFITAGTKLQEVPDDSIFRRYFVRAFAQREGDLNDDGFITGEELGMYLAGRVASDSRDTQTPRYGKIRNVRLNLGDFVFALPPRGAPTPTPPVYSGEQAYWRAIEDSRDAQDFRDYLRQYPNGVYAAAARVKLRRLEAAANANTTPVTNPNPAAPLPKPTPTPTPAVAYAKVGGTPARLVTMPFMTATVDARGNVTKQPGQPVNGFGEELSNGVRLEMVEVPAGSFEMGSPSAEAQRDDDEVVRRGVRINALYVGRYEVTQAQWKAVLDSLPNVGFPGDDLPVERVSWIDAVEFCQKLSAKTGREYRLPTEAEWEYAARAGTQTPFAFGATITPEIVNYDGNYPYDSAAKGVYREKTWPVERRDGVANAWGLFDMHGNVREWCQDWYGPYDARQLDNPVGPSTGQYRVLRGGSWYRNGRYCRAADRNGIDPDARHFINGLRVVVSARTHP
jgi:formylglycine-generating enzyme required for sulfatase activity